jgi:hypothetical protein
MDQDTVVIEQTKSGKPLIETLQANGFDIRLALWAKPADTDRWYLYLASPVVDEQGPRTAYRLVHGVLRQAPDMWIDPLEIRVVGLDDSFTIAASEAVRPKVPNSSFAVQDPKPFPGKTRLSGATLGGVELDGAYIYPPPPRQDAPV